MPIRYSERFTLETIDGPREFWAAPLSCETLEDRGADFDALVKPDTVVGLRELRLVVDMVHAAVVRNHPDVSRDDIRKLLDVRNCGEPLEAVLKACGFEKGTKPGEAGSP